MIERKGHAYIDVASGNIIDAWFPLQANELGEVKRGCLAEKVGLIRGEAITVSIDSLEDAPKDTADAYLRLHLLSERSVKPNALNLDGIFGLLPIVAWTSAGPVFPALVDKLKTLVADEYHYLSVTCVDRFPRMTDYVVPTGVRIADADRVRFGAHLSEGTTVMHEGFANFNAGTLGSAMVEGRISAGVVVGNSSDIGGGASIMGTLSGGGKEKITVGEKCLLGANAGIGISLGNDCIVEAGLYLTSGTKVTLPDGEVVSASQLSGASGLLFRRNSQTGMVQALPTNSETWGGLNTVLQSND